MRTRTSALVIALCSILSVGGSSIAHAHDRSEFRERYIRSHADEERVNCGHHGHACTSRAMRRHLRAQARNAFAQKSRQLRRQKPAFYFSHHGTVKSAIERAFPATVEDKATAVARCESELNVYAVSSSGRYMGLFQMGPEERQRFGFSWQKWTQARAAYRYWQISGWSPWPVCGD